MNCTVGITSHVSLGGGIGSYIAYKIDVSFDGKSWAIFRRFKDFCVLHDRLLAHYTKETLEEAGVVLPDHAVGLGKTFKFVTTKRMTGLQEYLTKMFKLDDIQTHSFVTGFLDVAQNGKSGALKELGGKGILLETFGSCKPCFKAFEFWHSVYLVLTKTGTLFIFKNYDDGLFQAFINFPIAGRDIHVQSRAGTKNIELSSADGSSPARVIINLPSDVAVASWLRSIADFGTRGGSSAASFSTPAKNNKSDSTTPATAASIEVKAKGTGHTADELSSMYGV